jgi:hypothetical protein
MNTKSQVDFDCLLQLSFSLHDANLFHGHGKSQAQELQLGVVEGKVYHNLYVR